MNKASQSFIFLYNQKSSLVIEYTLKYADFNNIKLFFELFGKSEVKNARFKKLKLLAS